MRRALSAPPLLPWLAFAGMILIWGTTFFAIRVSNNEGYGPFSAAAARLLGAAALLLLLVKARGVPFPRGRALWISAGAGTLMFGVNFLLLFWGEQTVTSATASVLWGVYPALVALGAAAFLKGEPLTACGVGGAGAAALGLAVVFWSRVEFDASALGMLAILGGILAATAGSLAVKRFVPGVHTLALNAVGATASLLLLVPAAFLSGEGIPAPPSPAAWAALLYLITFGSTAFILWAWLLQRWPATRVSFQTVLSPLVAVALGAVFLAEPAEPQFLAGAGLVLLGTLLAVRQKGSTRAARSDLGPSDGRTDPGGPAPAAPAAKEPAE